MDGLGKVLLEVLLAGGYGTFVVWSARRQARKRPHQPTVLPDGRRQLVDEVADVAVHVQVVEPRFGRVRTVLRALQLVPPRLVVAWTRARSLPSLAELPEPVRATAGRRFSHAMVHAHAGVVTVTIDHVPVSRGELDALVVVVVELARLGMDAVHALRELPGAVYEAPRGPWDARTPPRVRLPGHDATFEMRAHDDGTAYTAAWTQAPRAIRLEARREGDPTLAAHDGVLTLAWPGVETEHACLLAGAELLRATAASMREERYG